MANPEHIEHRGRIESIEGGLVRVRIVANSACGTCVARQACGMSESTEKIIDVKVGSAEAFVVGEEVMVAVHRTVGLWAVAVHLSLYLWRFWQWLRLWGLTRISQRSARWVA